MNEHEPLLEPSNRSIDDESSVNAKWKEEHVEPGNRCRCCFRVLWTLSISAIIVGLLIYVVLPALTVYHPHSPPTPQIAPTPPSINVLNLTSSQCWVQLFSSNSSGSSPIDYYNLTTCSNMSCFSMQMQQAGIARIPALNGSTSYSLSATAVNHQLASKRSTCVHFTTAPPTAPARPLDLTPVNASRTTLDIIWVELDCHGRPCLMATAFVSNASKSMKRGSWLETQNITCVSLQACKIPQLSPGRHYAIQVAVSNAVGMGPVSPLLTLMTTADNASLPPAPRTLDTSNLTHSSAMWTWSSVNDNGGSQILGYWLRYQANNAAWVYRRLAWDARSTNVTQLQAETQYCGQLRLTTAVGNSSWSESACATLPKPGEPGQAVINTTAVVANGTSIQMGYFVTDTGGAKQLTFEIQRDNWWLDQPLSDVANTTAHVYTSTELFPSQHYAFRVRALSSVGPGAWSDVVNLTTSYKGACGNPSDARAYYLSKKTMKPGIQKCLITHAASPSKAQQCVHDSLGLSMPCASCWIDEGQCTLKHCAAKCLNPGSAACKQCSEDQCFPDCVVCSGVPRVYFPP
eukprot:TRINITY_DN11095_c0_g1_i4.p1 TRINITY_DN11095_c0_g1~~TRINITY_DN11095_c0_g1_i4.p1  ORF type:complete len:574 (+),score=57.05 TRINITY_DN11095_c0_g1_i4:51-1772(+)